MTSVKVDEVIVEAFIASENVAPALAETPTPVAPSPGETLWTVGWCCPPAGSRSPVTALEATDVFDAASVALAV